MDVKSVCGWGITLEKRLMDSLLGGCLFLHPRLHLYLCAALLAYRLAS